jgi:uncharacterized iron-regulated protein
MKRETASLLFLTLAALLIVSVGCCRGEWIMRTADRQEIRFSRMMEEIKGSHLIFIGEEHDRMADHWRQLKVIKALHDAGVRLAIGVEMFTAESQGDLDRWVAGRISEEDFIRRFNGNWKEPWLYYRSLFYYARQHSIPMVGLNISREISHKVATMGFAALSASERRHIPGVVTCRVDDAYMALIRRAFSSHGLSDEAFTRFCEAQLLWNSVMAWNTIQYMEKNPHRTMIVLAGKGHAMKPGIPDEIRKLKKADLRVILPEDELFRRANVSESDTDYLFLDRAP